MNIIKIKEVHYEKDNTKILSGVSFDVKKRDCISIIGQSGSGKSTLMKLCADLIPMTKGDIIYREKSYREIDPTKLRKNISYCVQLPYLFGTSIYENLEFPFKIRKEAMDKTRVIELLKRFNLNEDVLDKDINSLSGGEKQRVALIRNLIYTPDVLLLDEATSALDKENAKVVEEYIKELNDSGTTVLWITHSLEQSEGIFNKRIVMSEGKVEKVEKVEVIR